MLFIQHRVNTSAQLGDTPTQFGVELDLRDRGDRLILAHDPFGDGEDFRSYLQSYRHQTLILNIKSERIEHRVLEEVRVAGVEDYFFLDCSFPMVRQLTAAGEHRIAVRFSEYEPLEGPLALAGNVDWVWVDCFTRLPLDRTIFNCLKQHFKICIVSPELQGHDLSRIAEFAEQLFELTGPAHGSPEGPPGHSLSLDAVCTKRPDLWQEVCDALSERRRRPLTGMTS